MEDMKLSETWLRFIGNPIHDETGLTKDTIYLVKTRETTIEERAANFGATIALKLVEEPQRETIFYGPDNFWSTWSWQVDHRSGAALCLNDSVILVAGGEDAETDVMNACIKLRQWAKENDKGRLNFRTERILVGPCDVDAVVAEQMARWRHA